MCLTGSKTPPELSHTEASPSEMDIQSDSSYRTECHEVTYTAIKQDKKKLRAN